MRLTSFQITEFRSINDSGEISTQRITAILGRNESGKSNLLRALASLKPPGGIQPLSKIKDFPRHRRLSEWSEDTIAVRTKWELDAAERAELVKLCPRARDVTTVQVSRPYGATYIVDLPGLSPFGATAEQIQDLIAQAEPALEAGAAAVGDQAVAVAAAVAAWVGDVTPTADTDSWPARAAAAMEPLRTAFAAAGSALPNPAATPVAEIERLATELQKDPAAIVAAQNWILAKLPTFVFLDDFPQLNGHQHIGEFLARRGTPQETEADRNFAKLCRVAGINPDELQSLHQSGDHESRNQLVNRASAVVTSEVRRLWKDRPLKIRFNLDADHLDTLISDPNETYDVEVNLDERSRGFRWFFSFYIVLSADTQGGNAEGAILLLDEPGLFLHALSQADLLRHFDNDFKNQIVYTTHSPFMVPTQAIERVRTAQISQRQGTTVSNDPTGDARTLFPLQSALGYSISQSLFLGAHNLVVEGVTDYWILSSLAGFIADRGQGTRLDKKFTLTPAGGAQRVSYMVALLTSERLQVVVLFDDERQSRATSLELLKSKLIREDGIAWVTEAFADPKPAEADIEDVLDSDVFDALVREAYAEELSGKTLALNASIPRIAKRYEAAFADLGIEFFKTRPARLLLDKMGTAPDEIATPATIERFQRLFASLNKRLAKIVAKDAEPFA
jgi:predicted ATPase